ncbi:hypothetical protein A3733_34475 [Pseudoalteromonas shioyasakiensis]|nr:hypothetical protein A3733_34475 [Pseudoalteromonas shioyasakiensis]
MDLHLAPNSTQFFSMCRAKTLAQNRSVFGNAEVNVDVRYSLLAACQVKSKPNQQNCKMRYVLLQLILLSPSDFVVL